jgi:hypothetical protein
LGPSLCAAHNQHDEFARLEEAERNGTITKEDKIKLGEWKGGLSRGGALFLGVELHRLAQQLCTIPAASCAAFPARSTLFLPRLRSTPPLALHLSQNTL